IVLRQHQVCFGSGSALMLGLAKATPFAAEKISVTGKGKLCCWLQDFFGPAVKVVLGHFKGGYILSPWLIHGHCYRVNVVNGIEQLQCTECVAHHLGIVIRIDQNSETM